MWMVSFYLIRISWGNRRNVRGYPPMRKLLPDEPNIKQFAARFSAIGACADSAQAKAFLFSDGARNAHSANATALQKLALTHPKALGYTCGIITI